MVTMRTDFVKVDNFYLSDDTLKRDTPSRKAGVDEETESAQRLYGAEVIQTCGICLKFPQVVMCTGQVLLQRFYCKRSLTQYDVKAVALTCLWLAAKLEEVPNIERYMWKVLMVFDRVTKRMDGKSLEVLELHSKKYYKMRDEVVRIEKDMLIAFGFVMHVEHPHKQVMNYLTALSRRKAGEAAALSEAEEGRINEIMQRAFSLVNDSLRTTLCVRFKAEIVACAAIFMAARQLKVPLPEADEGPNWWDLFDVELASMAEVCRTILHLYSLPKAAYTPLALPAVRKPPATAPGSKAAPRAERRALLAEALDPFDTPPTSVMTGVSGGAPASATPPLPSKRPPTEKRDKPDTASVADAEASGAENGAAGRPPPRDKPPAERPKERRPEPPRDRERERERSGSRGAGRAGAEPERWERDRREEDRDRRPREERRRDYRRDSADRRDDGGRSRPSSHQPADAQYRKRDRDAGHPPQSPKRHR